MLRITTGTAKNKKLNTPDIEGYRAVQEVAKSAVFSILGDKVTEAACLDLFAGSGNMGLEALSRGAEHCDFVDENGEAIKTIESNLFICGFVDNYGLFRKNAIKYVAGTDKKYDIVFADPFYKDQNFKFLMKNLANIINETGVIVFFHDKNTEIEASLADSGLKVDTQRHFGQGAFTVLSI